MTLLSACGGGGGTSGSWKYVGSSEGLSAGSAGDSSLFVYGGMPYVAYRDGTQGDKITVKKFNGSEWETLGSEGFAPSAGIAEDIDLFVYNGIPYVSYRATSDSAVRVMTYNGVSWTSLGVTVAAATSGKTSLYVYDSIPYVAFVNSAQKAAVYYYSGGWYLVGGAPVGTGVSTISLSGANGVLYLALDDSSMVKVMKSNGGSTDLWVQEGSDVSADSAYFISLAMNNAAPYVAYQDADSKIRVFKYTSSWQPVGSSTLPAGEAYYTRLCISNGVPYIAFQDGFALDEDRTTVMRFNGSQWVTVGPAQFSPANTSDLAFYVDNGVPYVAFNHQDIGYKLVVLKYD